MKIEAITIFYNFFTAGAFLFIIFSGIYNFFIFRYGGADHKPSLYTREACDPRKVAASYSFGVQPAIFLNTVLK